MSTFFQAETNKATKPGEERRDFRCFKIKYLSLLEAGTAGAAFDCSRQLDFNGNLTICINNFYTMTYQRLKSNFFPSLARRSVRTAKRAD